MLHSRIIALPEKQNMRAPESVCQQMFTHITQWQQSGFTQKLKQ